MKRRFAAFAAVIAMFGAIWSGCGSDPVQIVATGVTGTWSIEASPDGFVNLPQCGERLYLTQTGNGQITGALGPTSGTCAGGFTVTGTNAGNQVDLTLDTDISNLDCVFEFSGTFDGDSTLDGTLDGTGCGKASGTTRFARTSTTTPF